MPEATGDDTLKGAAGSGQASAGPPGSDLKLSPALHDFLQAKGVDPQSILTTPPVRAPASDGSHPLSAYLISSSHNTYLSGNQLYGESEASQYTEILKRGGRCVEIDCWDGDDGEPIVYHGFTLTKKILFRDVAIAIGKAVGPDDHPVVVSFECHVGPEQQKRVVEIAKEVWAGKLIDSPVDGDNKTMITLDQARGRILLKVEYCHGIFPAFDETIGNLTHSAEDAQSSDESDEEGKAQADGEDPAALAMRKKRKKAPKSRIVKELGLLGVYTTSLKPNGDDFLRKVPQRHHSIVANISESALGKHIATRLEAVVHHNASHFTRVYPKGLRVNSKNLNPLQYWQVGAQITALNWQKFDRGMQLNEALFVGGGWLLKPDYLRIQPGEETTAPMPPSKRSRLELKLVGASNLPKPKDAKSGLNAYVEVELCTPKDSHRQKTKTYKPDKKDETKGSDPMWQQTLTFDFEREYFTFLRLLFVHDDSWHSRDDRFATYCLFLPYVQPGYHAARLIDLQGAVTNATVVFKVDVKDV